MRDDLDNTEQKPDGGTGQERPCGGAKAGSRAAFVALVGLAKRAALCFCETSLKKGPSEPEFHVPAACAKSKNFAKKGKRVSTGDFQTQARSLKRFMFTKTSKSGQHECDGRIGRVVLPFH